MDDLTAFQTFWKISKALISKLIALKVKDWKVLV
jgi:hypothetical protein